MLVLASATHASASDDDLGDTRTYEDLATLPEGAGGPDDADIQDGPNAIESGAPTTMLEPAWLEGLACRCDEKDVRRALASAPPLERIVRRALATAGVADDPVPAWVTRSRWSALVPTISGRLGNSLSWREVTDPTVSRATSYDVRASWRLDRLVFDPNAPRLAAFDLQRRRERRRIAAVTAHTYFVWLQARASLAGAATNPDRGPPGVRVLIQAQRARAELDALTDGWFSTAAR